MGHALFIPYLCVCVACGDSGYATLSYPTLSYPCGHARYLQLGPDSVSKWDFVVYETARAFQRQSYDFLMWNCHSFLASVLNRVEYPPDALASLLRGWTVAGVAARLFFSARYAGAAGALRTWGGHLGIWLVVLLKYWSTGSTELLVHWLWLLAGVNSLFIVWFVLVTVCGLHSQWGILHAERTLDGQSDEDGDMHGASQAESLFDDMAYSQFG